jgi:thymidylate synthase ThyX
MPREFPGLDVYSLSDYPEEIKGIATAKCSRSPNTFKQDADLLTSEKAAELHEKIVVGYGHNSVADMSFGSLCFEGISTLMAETLFDIQTGKFQAKSSRYVAFSRQRVVQPFDDYAGAGKKYRWAIDSLFDAYENLFPAVLDWVKQQPNMADKPDAVIKARAFDALRYLLPLGCRTNVGTRFSSRDTAYLVRVLRSHPLDEAQALADRIVTASQVETPTLLRHAEHQPLFDNVNRLNLYDKTRQGTPNCTFVHMVEHDQGALYKVLDTMGFEAGLGYNYSDMEERADARIAGERVLNQYMAQRKTRHDPVPHGFRRVRYHFTIQSDFGAWKDLRRHRRCELFREEHFTARLGWTTPQDIVDIGVNNPDVEKVYHRALREASEVWAELSVLYPAEAQYLVTHAHIQPWEINLDLEQLYYIGELRTEPFGHISYRRIAATMVEQAAHREPGLFQHILVHPVEGVEAHH